MPKSGSESNQYSESNRESELQSKIRALSLTEVKILFYKCEGIKYRQLRKLLYITQDELEAATARLYGQLGFELDTNARVRDHQAKEIFCPILEQMMQALPGKAEAKFAHWPPPPPTPQSTPTPPPVPGTLIPYDYQRALAVVRREIMDEEKGADPREEEPNVPLIPGGGGSIVIPNRKPRGSGRVIAVLWLLSLCLVAGLVGSGAYLLSLRFAPAPGRETQIVIVTATPLPATPTVSPSQTPVVVTDVPTAEPLSVATQTAWVITATPLPASATPAPTNTPTFQLPFADSFDLGIRPEWLTTGILLTDGGMLASAGNDDATLSIGDATLDNYELTVDFSSGDSGGNYEFNLLFGSKLSLRVNYYNLQWYVKDGDYWTEAGADFFNSHPSGTLRVLVHGSAATVLMGANTETFGFAQSLAGPLTIVDASSGTRLDNFSLTALP